MYGKIMEIQYQIGSGLFIMFIEDENGNINRVLCEAAPTFRALQNAFDGDFMGKNIEYEVDDNGILAFFFSDQEDVIENYITEKRKFVS